MMGSLGVKRGITAAIKSVRTSSARLSPDAVRPYIGRKNLARKARSYGSAMQRSAFHRLPALVARNSWRKTAAGGNYSSPRLSPTRSRLILVLPLSGRVALQQALRSSPSMLPETGGHNPYFVLVRNLRVLGREPQIRILKNREGFLIGIPVFHLVKVSDRLLVLSRGPR